MISTRDETILRLIIGRCLEAQRRARDYFGDEAQDLKVAEECSELLTVLLQSQSRDVPTEEIVTEAADVFFVVLGMLDSLNGWPELQRKLERLERRLDRQ